MKIETDYNYRIVRGYGRIVCPAYRYCFHNGLSVNSNGFRVVMGVKQDASKS